MLELDTQHTKNDKHAPKFTLTVVRTVGLCIRGKYETTKHKQTHKQNIKTNKIKLFNRVQGDLYDHL